MMTSSQSTETPRILSTERFGEVHVKPSNTLEFVQPILGFEQAREFVLIDHDDDSPFKWLQAVENEGLAFITTNPTIFGIEYDFTLPQEACNAIGLTKAEDAQVLTLITIPNNVPTAMTVNLAAPIVFNETNRKAMQLVLPDEAGYSTKVRLISENMLEA
jgi:flagellar assembly factor FliW